MECPKTWLKFVQYAEFVQDDELPKLTLFADKD